MNKGFLFLCTFLLYLAIGAAFFDEWWHADGRVETFFTLPHALLYSAIFLNGVIVLSFVILQLRKIGHFAPFKIPNRFPVALAGTGSLIQLIAGGFDMVYHEVVGFDVTIWSPPHLMAIYGGVISALGFACMWRSIEHPSKVYLVGYSFTIAAAILYGQFSLSEYLLDGPTLSSRFETEPIWFVILNSLYLGFLLTIAIKQTYRPIATLILVIVFGFQALLSLIWPPTTYEFTMAFPFIMFVGTILLDIMIAQDRLKNAIPIGLITNGIIQSLLIWYSVNHDYTYSLGVSIVANIIVSFCGYWLANRILNGIEPSLFFKKSISISFVLLLMISFPVYAHGEQAHSTAPDMHPLFVMLEFTIIMIVGYWLANRISKLGARGYGVK